LQIEHQIPVLQPHSLKLDGKYPLEAKQTQEYLIDCEFDVMVVAAYGLILPLWLLDFASTSKAYWDVLMCMPLCYLDGVVPHRFIELFGLRDALTGTCIMKMAEGFRYGANYSTRVFIN
jgi:methionyl-tRNA formyltransferase